MFKLKNARVKSALINAGGDIYCLGDNNGKPWRVNVQDPRHPKHMLRRLKVENRAVATSGDYEQFFDFRGRRYSHIIDPATGYPANAGISSATVIASNALTADALSTSLMILGMEKAREVLRRFPGVNAILVDVNGRVHEF